jgi:UDP-glucose 4-epimerase
LNPLRDFTLNTYNVIKLLDAIRMHRPNCKFVNLSSAAVYGNPELLPVSEWLPLRPISPYGTHKMQAEEACSAYHKFYNTSTCSLRVFSAYGNGLKKQLFWDIFQKAKKQDTFELYGTGNETRDFIHIHDLARAIDYCIEFANFKGEAINIANGEEIAIIDAVSIFLSFFNRNKTPIYNGKTKQGDPLNWKADVSVLTAMGYTPAVDITNGLKNYYQWITQLQ